MEFEWFVATLGDDELEGSAAVKVDFRATSFNNAADFTQRLASSLGYRYFDWGWKENET